MQERWLMRIMALVAALGAILAQPAAAAEPGCRPDVAAWRPPVMKASLKADEARISFVGHATFLIESAQGVTAATDYNDYVRPSIVPVIASMNKAHSTHYSRNPDPGIAHVLPGWDPAGGKAQHDVTVKDMRVRNVPTNIRSFSGATDFDANSMFVFEVGELCIVHLGHLHHTLEPGHLRALGRVDVVLVPVDGGYTLDMDGMLEVLQTLQARIIIPMHFFGQSTLERFLAKATATWPVERRDVPSMIVSRASLPRLPTVIVLPGR
ncbi:MAG: MBL fold metallo-hydrolase [Hyphomicrobiales bacterium]|nr:MBL fold metallo-hydrolase [Hyphomicrobiales bacterium]